MCEKRDNESHALHTDVNTSCPYFPRLLSRVYELWVNKQAHSVAEII